MEYRNKTILGLIIIAVITISIISLLAIDSYNTQLKINQLKKELIKPDFSYEKEQLRNLESRINN